MNPARQVVITGLGLCTPVGNRLEDFWANLLAGHSGIGPITLFDATAFPVRIGGEVKGLDVDELVKAFPELIKEPDRKIRLGVYAAQQAIAHAGLADEALRRASLHVGVSLETVCLEQLLPLARLENELPESFLRALAAHRETFLQISLDRTATLLAENFGIIQGQYTNCSACAAGAQAIGEASRRVRNGEVDLAIAGATDSVLHPLGLGGFSLLHILSEENDMPSRACRPFDLTRQGTVLSEGAAFLVLESKEHAQQRGASIHAELLGYGSSMDAYRVSDPEPEGRGARLSMIKAVRDGNLDANSIDCVNAHGTGTPKNDVMETKAIKAALGDHAFDIPVYAIKSMTGHMIAASGAVEAIASVLTLVTRQIPPTINLNHPDPACDLDYAAHGPRDFVGKTVLSNSFGFGGQNASLVFGRWPARNDE